MKPRKFLRWSMAAAVCVSMIGTLIDPAYGFFWNKKNDEPELVEIYKNGLIGSEIEFAAEDFQLKDGKEKTLEAVIVDTLPEAGAGTLQMGGQPVEAGSRIEISALGGLRFSSNGTGKVEKVSFQITPVCTDGTRGKETTVNIILLTRENQRPIARNMDLSTYKNVAITGYFDAMDGEGDVLQFQLTSNPARGAVELAQDGSSRFVYKPYENKTGKDTFTYVAVDPAGNVSEQAKVTVQIEKANTAVTYADMDGHPAHKAAIRLAQEKVCVGSCIQGKYFFQPEQPVSRGEFLTMAMGVIGMEPMDGVTETGFYDDDDSPEWVKGSVCAALKAGVIQGTKDEQGAPVFGAQDTVTMAQAVVMLDQMLNLADVPAEVFAPGGEEHWATQSAANLISCGVMRRSQSGAVQLSMPMSRGEAAQLLDGALEVMQSRRSNGILGFGIE